MLSAKYLFPLFGAVLVFASYGRAASYFVAPEGKDSNSGNSSQPWRTIQKAANVLSPGDTVIVRAGEYHERIETVRSGTGEAGRITFQSDGKVVLLGWLIDHEYITIQGFEISGWSAPSTVTAHVEVTSDADFFQMFDCVVRDGIQLVVDDALFDSSNRTINSAQGGFIASRFAPGQTLYVGRAAYGPSTENSGLYTIEQVTDNSITVNGTLLEEGPLSIYLSASFVFGLVLRSGTQNCVIRNNVFRNLGYDTWLITGNGHLIEENRIEQSNGWDAMHFGGSNHIFRKNIIRQSPLLVQQVSPDAMENYSPAPYSNVTFSNNFVQGFAGVLAAQKGENTSFGLRISHNVFVDVGRFIMTHPGTTFEQNTLLRVARTNTPVTSIARHPLVITTSVGATNIVIRNNIFLDGGMATGTFSQNQVGWYDVSGPSGFVTAEGNFVAGGEPEFEAKVGWPENNNLLNGGDPGFVNIQDPLGPDEVPFTDDDGLHLRSDSKLIGAGVGGVDVGAYSSTSSTQAPRLSISSLGGIVIRFTWPISEAGYKLQSRGDLEEPWADTGLVPVIEGNSYVVQTEAVGNSQMFRLSR